MRPQRIAISLMRHARRRAPARRLRAGRGSARSRCTAGACSSQRSSVDVETLAAADWAASALRGHRARRLVVLDVRDHIPQRRPSRTSPLPSAVRACPAQLRGRPSATIARCRSVRLRRSDRRSSVAGPRRVCPRADRPRPAAPADPRGVSQPTAAAASDRRDTGRQRSGALLGRLLGRDARQHPRVAERPFARSRGRACSGPPERGQGSRVRSPRIRACSHPAARGGPVASMDVRRSRDRSGSRGRRCGRERGDTRRVAGFRGRCGAACAGVSRRSGAALALDIRARRASSWRTARAGHRHLVQVARPAAGSPRGARCSAGAPPAAARARRHRSVRDPERGPVDDAHRAAACSAVQDPLAAAEIE